MPILFQTSNAFRLETKKNTLFNLHILTRIKIYNFLIKSKVFTRFLTDFMVIINKIQNAENPQLEKVYIDGFWNNFARVGSKIWLTRLFWYFGDFNCWKRVNIANYKVNEDDINQKYGLSKTRRI